MERGYGTLRGLGAPLRRPWCLAWSHPRPREQAWRMGRLSNLVMPHQSWRPGRTSRTPARARGLTDQARIYREYTWLLGYTDPVLSKQMDERMARLLTPALQDLPRGKAPAPPPVATRGEHEQAAAPLPKAAVSPLGSSSAWFSTLRPLMAFPPLQGPDFMSAC
jgi:hypothetical protein